VTPALSFLGAAGTVTGAKFLLEAEGACLLLRGFERPPSATWAVHGEPPAAAALREAIERELGWAGCRVAEDGARVGI